MRRFVFLAVVVALVLTAALAWQAPAALAGVELARASGGALVLADAEGTIWRGRGTLVAGVLRVPVQWRTHPDALLHREVNVTLMPASDAASAPRAEISAASNALRVRDLRIDIPASILAEALFTRPRLDAAGTIEVSSAAFEWPLTPTSTGTLATTWRGAKVGLPGATPIDLGDVTTTLQAADGRLAGPLRNTGGELGIDGELQVFASGGGLVRGVVRPRRPDDPRAAALQALGTPEGDGVRLEWRWPGR